jgi:S1-C subfamily serine protease
MGPMHRPRHSLVGAVALAMAVPVSGAAATTPSAGRAAAIDRGVVDVDSRLVGQDARAAGTGMLLDRAGLVLTNDHVIRGGTRIRVTVHGGRRYKATVLGTDAGQDVALLKLARVPADAPPVRLGDSSRLVVGQRVRAVGNAGGAGGAPSVAAGRITALDRSIVATDDASAGVELLNGLIQVDARLRPGDSGGPLVDAAGAVVGMDTAATAGSPQTGGAPEGFAIPIDRALAVAREIRTAPRYTSVRRDAAGRRAAPRRGSNRGQG